jgi:hypothetical protein
MHDTVLQGTKKKSTLTGRYKKKREKESDEDQEEDTLKNTNQQAEMEEKDTRSVMKGLLTNHTESGHLGIQHFLQIDEADALACELRWNEQDSELKVSNVISETLIACLLDLFLALIHLIFVLLFLLSFFFLFFLFTQTQSRPDREILDRPVWGPVQARRTAPSFQSCGA